jgi:YD repeat-containing protein
LIVSSKVFFDTGEVQKSTDPCLYSTSFLYSSTYRGALPTTVTNPLNQGTTNAYDFNTGLLTTTTDPNLQPTGYTYDPSWRTTGVGYPDGGQTSYTYNDSIPASVTVTKAISATLSLVKIATVDGLGRLQQTQLVDPNCHSTSGLVNVDYGYGYNLTATAITPTGAYTSVSNPYCQTSDSTYGVTTSNDDALGRAASVIQSDASAVVTSYAGNCTTVADEAGKARQSCVDALGRMTGVWEDPAGLNYETDYFYDALGNLTNVTQKGSNSANARSRTFAYDSLSGLTSAANPESGTITYAYDADGNAVTKTAPKYNQTGSATVTTTYLYDKLNRLTKKSYSDGTTAIAQYQYDATPALSGCGTTPPAQTDVNPIGHRTQMCDGSGAASWVHDTMGRPLQERRVIGAASGKSIIYAYNLDGSLGLLQTPPLKTVSYTYNGAARAIKAVDSVDVINFVTGATYASHGALAGMTLGSTSSAGTVVTDTYNKRLQPALLSAASPSGSVISLCYDFHVGGGLTLPPCPQFTGTTPADNGIRTKS